MSESIIIFLEKLPEDKVQIFYNDKAAKFEITDPDVIKFFLSVFNSLKLRKKGFIEDTEDEFKASGRTSDDYIAKTLCISSSSYKTLMNNFKIQIDKEKNLFNKDSDDYLEKLEKFLHLVKLSHFLMLYSDLTENIDYSSYTYYIYEEKK